MRTRSIVAATAGAAGTGPAPREPAAPTLGAGRTAAVAAGAFDSRGAATGVTATAGTVVFATTGCTTGASVFPATAGAAAAAASSTRMRVAAALDAVFHRPAERQSHARHAETVGRLGLLEPQRRHRPSRSPRPRLGDRGVAQVDDQRQRIGAAHRVCDRFGRFDDHRRPCAVTLSSRTGGRSR